MDNDSTILKGATVTPKELNPTRARNLLGIPDDDDMIDSWALPQKRDYIMLRVLEQVQTIDEKGCSKRGGDIARLERLENWWPTIKFAGATVIIVGGVLGFIWAMIQFSKRVQL